MIRNILTLCLSLLIATGAIAQAKTKYTPESHHTWAIKGKILPWIAGPLPITGMNYTLGGEYAFARRHAIGLELVYNDHNTHQEYYNNPNNPDSAGSSFYSVSRGVFLYYKRYIDIQNSPLKKPLTKLAGCNVLPYTSVFLRYGKTDWHPDASYETNTIAYDDWQYSGGLLVGAIAGKFDINFGPFYKQHYISSTEHENGQNVLHSHMQPSFGFRLGVNVFLIGNRHGDHLLARYRRGEM